MSEEHRPLSPTPDAEQPPKQSVPPEPAPDRPPRPVSRGQQKRRQQSVFQYIAVLFAAAFVLLLLTFLMERRQYERLQAENQEQIDNLQQSVSAVQSLDNLYKENDALKEQVDALEERLEALQALQEKTEQDASSARQQQAVSQESLKAMDWFWQIDEAYVRGKYSQCRSLIRTLEELGLVESLPRESATDNGRFSPYDRYQEIYDHVF